MTMKSELTEARTAMEQMLVDLKDIKGVNAAKSLIFRVGKTRKMSEVPDDLVGAVTDAARAAISARDTPARKTEMPAALAAPYGDWMLHAQRDKIDHRGPSMSVFHVGIPGDLHSSTVKLVLDTANLMGQKLFNAQQKYGFTDGWQDTKWANPKEGATFEADDAAACRSHAFSHVLKGDPVDVANYSAFQMHHGWSSAPASRDEAKTWVEMLQKKYDLIDENEVLRDLIDKMEERQGETFNAFYEGILRRVMINNGLNQIVISTKNLMQDLVSDGEPLDIAAVKDNLIYRLKDSADE